MQPPMRSVGSPAWSSYHRPGRSVRSPRPRSTGDRSIELTVRPDEVFESQGAGWAGPLHPGGTVEEVEDASGILAPYGIEAIKRGAHHIRRHGPHVGDGRIGIPGPAAACQGATVEARRRPEAQRAVQRAVVAVVAGRGAIELTLTIHSKRPYGELPVCRVGGEVLVQAHLHKVPATAGLDPEVSRPVGGVDVLLRIDGQSDSSVVIAPGLDPGGAIPLPDLVAKQADDGESCTRSNDQVANAVRHAAPESDPSGTYLWVVGRDVVGRDG